jgi:hypothetical protein
MEIKKNGSDCLPLNGSKRCQMVRYPFRIALADFLFPHAYSIGKQNYSLMKYKLRGGM